MGEFFPGSPKISLGQTRTQLEKFRQRSAMGKLKVVDSCGGCGVFEIFIISLSGRDSRNRSQDLSSDNPGSGHGS